MWRPPKYSHKLAKELQSLWFGSPPLKGGPANSPDCNVANCENEATWWTPQQYRAFCDKHCADHEKPYFKKYWVFTLYTRFLKVVGEEFPIIKEIYKDVMFARPKQLL